MDFNILGVGPAEMVLIFLIMLIFLGPKRMMSWTYTAGKYTARLRAQFNEMMAAVRKEFEEAQIDLPKDLSIPRVPRGRFDIVKEANKVVSQELNRPAAGAATTATTAAAAAAAEKAAANGSSAANGTGAANTGSNGQSPAGASDTATSDEQGRYDAWLPK